MKMLNALLYAAQCAIAQEFGSRENFWRVFQLNPTQDLSVTLGTAELSYFMWGTRNRAVHSTIEQLANTLKDLSYVQEEDAFLNVAKAHSVFGYISVPKGKNCVTVTFRNSHCQAYFHPKALYSTLRLESMFSVRSLWTCFLLELGAKHSGHPNKVTKGRTLEQWCLRAKGFVKGPCRTDNVHRALRLACQEVESIRKAGLCDYIVKIRKARTRLSERDLVRFEISQAQSIPTLAVAPESADSPKDSAKTSGATTQLLENNQPVPATEVVCDGLMLTLVERLKLKTEKAREVLKKYGESKVRAQFEMLLAYLKQNPNTLRNPPGFFLRLLEGTVSLQGFDVGLGGSVCVESLSNWAIAQERRSQIEREQANDRILRLSTQQGREQRQIVLERFKDLSDQEQEYFHSKTLESLNGNPSLRGLVQGNRFHALVLKSFKETLSREAIDECYNT